MKKAKTRKVWISAEVHEEAAKEAEKRGQNVDEFIASAVRERIMALSG